MSDSPGRDPSAEHFGLIAQVMQELLPEMEAQRALGPARPPLDQVLAGLGPLPRRALFLGLADDGLPILLDLHDPSPGPLLLTADPRAGKTLFLRHLTRAAARLQSASELQWCALSAHPGQWSGEEDAQRVGVFPPYERTAGDLLLSLTSWAQSGRGARQSVLLLIDGLELAAHLDFEAQTSLRWLLANGPARRIWPIATVSPARRSQALDWLPAFRTHLFGRVTDRDEARALAGDGVGLHLLAPGAQFVLREGSDWVRFWLPAVEG